MRSLKRTKVLKANKNSITYGAKVLREGGLVAFPTETVYGLGANALKKKALDNLYRAKARRRSKPFSILISDFKIIKRMGCALTAEAESVLDGFWPGPLTAILKARSGKKIGFRMPDNRVALELVKKSAVPVACPSANISGGPLPKDAREVTRQLYGRIDLILDGGRTRIGVESTVVDFTVSPPKILREGAIKRKTIFKLIA